ncbi:hypothetical protein RHO15_09685 [Utexia brackfieldae]|uniref:hypothetical protein n=1 Tax=Utexia brackfieldae TaxID=3074108 RepID=UPI00370D2218
MTKLSTEQIEQERVKFNEWFSKLRNNEHFTSINLFDVWLAGAELAKGNCDG